MEAWDRLEGVEVGKRTGDKETVETIVLTSEKSSDIGVETVEKAPILDQVEEVEPEEPVELQATFSDFGLYKCQSCGKMVMGFEKEVHAKARHAGKKVEWKKVR